MYSGRKKSSDKLGKDKQTWLSSTCVNCCLDHRTLMQLGVEVGGPAPRVLRSEMQCVVNMSVLEARKFSKC